MKIKFYLVAVLIFLSFYSRAQDCAALTFTYTTSESRCMATGSITVTVTGGSGNYNYKAVGPVVTPVTSSNVITGLAPGDYSVIVKDINTACTTQVDNIHVDGSYSDPRFQLTKTDATCAGNDGSISTLNQEYGRSPFTYTIVDPSPSNVGASNATGSFTGLTPGEYVIQLQDSCGGIQVRRITIESYNWWFDGVSVIRDGCDNANVSIGLKDNKGNSNTTGTAFDGFSYGYVMNGDTTWNAAYNFSVVLGKQRNLDIVVKDNCGNVHATTWNLPENQKPSLNSVSLSNLVCSTFTASVSGNNLTDPTFSLYDNSNNLVNSNATGTFDDLAYGSYCIEAYDACYDTTITRCFTANQPTPSVSETVGISNQNCTTFTATVTGQANLTNPTYCLYDESDLLIKCNGTGVFDNVPYGAFCIKIHEECTDTTISRCFTTVKPVATLTGYSYTGSGCSSFGVQVSGVNLVDPQYCLYDSEGNVITCNDTGSFDDLPYADYCVSAISCGETTNSVCFSGSRPVPSVGSVQVTQRNCTTFDVTVTGQTNLTTPQFCLYDENDSQIDCNATGIFTGIEYGSYCIKIVNTCYDTTIVKCFTEEQPEPSINSSMQLLSSNCTSVSFKVNGSNLTSPQYCLYNASGESLGCNSTGSFSGYAYGEYCVTVEDGCVDTTMSVCQTFEPVKGISLTTSKSCTIGKAYVNVQFSNSNAPYAVKVYHPDGSLVLDNTTSANPYRIELLALPSGAEYKIVATDNCGNKDSANVAPDANIVTKSTTVRSKCPSSVWQNGSGDILATATTNYHSVSPQIIKKDGASFSKSYSSVSGSTYTFADLEPAEYIVQYTQSSCNGKLYDTVTVAPYAYPTQGQSAVYQCDNDGFTLNADVKNGVSPYTFQIIGSLPESPSIISDPQSSPTFSINNGTNYSLVRLRTVDACGNATLSDVSVLPLQNISVRASDSCFYQDITLSIDTIPNAVYEWYHKTTPTDSVLIGADLTYNLPFFEPDQVGEYVCKVNVNDGCITRLSSFNLTGNCYDGVLAASIHLQAKKASNANHLFWKNINEGKLIRYVVERRQANETSFKALGTVTAKRQIDYVFDDLSYGSGTIHYRLKLEYQNRSEYTNAVELQNGPGEIHVYPNPVKDALNISLSSARPTDFKIELLGANGQLYYNTEVKNTSSSTLTFLRNSHTPAGMYLLRITDLATGKTETRKLVFD